MEISPAQHQENLWNDFIKKIQLGENLPFEKHWEKFNQVYSDRNEKDGPALAWFPDDNALKKSNIALLMQELNFTDYKEFHTWTANNRSEFWQKVIEKLSVVFKTNPSKIINLPDDVKNPDWLPGAKLNCVDSCFTAPDDQPAIISSSENSNELNITSYADLEKLVNRIANGLIENNFKINDAIAIYMPMTVECVAAYLAIIKCGFRVVSIADSFSAEELNKRLEISKSKAIITVDFYSRAGKNIYLYNKVKEANSPKAIIINTDNSTPNIRDTDILWTDFLSKERKFESVICTPYDVINILFSSGTTGAPKAIPWNHLTPIKNAMDGCFHQDLKSGDVVCWPTNIGWMMGPWLIFATFINQGTMALYEGAPVTEGFVRFVKDAKVNMLGVIPSIVRAWRTNDLVKQDDWQDINVFSSTGEPSNREDYLWLMSRTRYKAPVIEYLGGTEIGGGHITGTVVQAASPATFSTAALGLDFVFLNEENNPVNEGEMGELFLIPPSIGLSQKLLNKDHEKTYYKDCPFGPEHEILRRHGDHMAKLFNGYFRAQGRADDTMNLGGIKVSSLELETVINQHSSIYESAAIAVQPQGEGQEKLVIFIILKQNINVQILKNDLNKLIGTKINPLFKIFDLIIRTELPRTASNKLMRRVLRKNYNADN
ncbi:MAG: AMP-dependent synthetase [Calditrichaeota bacterium]|nr:MAG: AMP-dependent synthetase [Calditrichota bacterium]MBL1203826.1 AMP-dependent synthetase [Calditrichota bacterium]NOG43657.1 AMP-binding protein [Calditrichota bacterium]